MRLAFADLMFSWPPKGGADVDLYHTLLHLGRLGHEIRLAVAAVEGSWERGDFDPGALPFPVSKLEFRERAFSWKNVTARFKREIEPWEPDAVIVADGFFLKPYLLAAFAKYPLITRYYAYEMALGPSLELHDGQNALPFNYMREPNACRRATLRALRGPITTGPLTFYAREYLAARAYAPAYAKIVADALRATDAAIVYNDVMAGHLAGYVARTQVVPGGVDLAAYPCEDRHSRPDDEKKVILMTGRVEDPLKGRDVLLRAGRLLADKRDDFEIRVTDTDPTHDCPWFKAVGRRPHAEMMALYRGADLAVVPSLWDEPFGMVAVEAMATGLPVCASRVGGLQHIVLDGETGYLFERGDHGALAAALERLLNDKALRLRLGEAARRRVESEYDWPVVVEKRFLPVIEEAVK